MIETPTRSDIHCSGHPPSSFLRGQARKIRVPQDLLTYVNIDPADTEEYMGLSVLGAFVGKCTSAAAAAAAAADTAAAAATTTTATAATTATTTTTSMPPPLLLLLT